MRKNDICPKTRLRCQHLEGCRRGNCRYGAGALAHESQLSKDDLYKLVMSEKPKQTEPAS